MIHYITGDILQSKADALVNTVNTVGVMGKGIALQFKNSFPSNFKVYVEACKKGEVEIGKMLVVKDSNLQTGSKLIVNFPTKKDWRKPSEYSFNESGLNDLIRVIDEFNIQSIAIPPLGAGNGGLDWNKVKSMIDGKLSGIDIDILVYEPTPRIQEKLKKERVKLTEGRALLLYVLYHLVQNGEYVSEFSSEKTCYFLQKFGARKYLNLNFTPNFYGPYSGKVRYVLYALNGSYIMGYSDMDRKPFEPLTLINDGFEEVKHLVNSNAELYKIANETTRFLDGFYSDYALELLSTIDYIMIDKKTEEKEIILNELNAWSHRKRSKFSDERHIDISLHHLKRAIPGPVQ